LALIIVLAMTALVGLLVYQGIDQRNEDQHRERENLTRLASFAAQAQRARFDAVERFLVIASTAQSLRTVALAPNDREAVDACTRALFVSEQLVTGARFALFDRSGQVLCSSRAARPGEYTAANSLWFRNATERQAFSTGAFEVTRADGLPSLTFGTPIRGGPEGPVLAYLSANLEVEQDDISFAGIRLPDTGRLTIVDQNGVVINSTSRSPGDVLPLFPPQFSTLPGYLDTALAEGNGRTGAAVRITDNDDALVEAVVSAENDALVTPVLETIWRVLLPVGILTLLTLIAVWLLARQWIVRPVEALVRTSDAITRGNLGARARMRSGVSEFEQLGAAFNEMAETRERASDAKDEFLGLVSHELKTPITTALGNAEILRTRGDRLDAESRQIALDDIHDSALRLNAIIENLLVLARLERGAALETEPLSLLRMTRTLADELLRTAPGRMVIVRGDSNALALGGETYVEQVLRNLVGNAIKYSPEDAPVEVLVEAGDGMAVLRVLDRGQGIDESEREAIFQPFYRSERTATFAEGIGIGLSVCKRLIEAMGGQIWCEARDGGGTEFGFSLPLEAEEPTTAESDDEPMSLLQDVVVNVASSEAAR
jgi:signal transduction histidine kinase